MIISSQPKGGLAMNAYRLADAFQRYVADERSDGASTEPCDLFQHFDDWAWDEVDLIGNPVCNYVVVLQAFLIISARFTQHPERFAGIRDVTVPLDLDAYDGKLMGILDESQWSRRARRKHGRQARKIARLKKNCI
jgi:hypothetical protein